jgi:hypothetical protein
MFGMPNTGLHKYRIFNIAIIDVVLTIILALIINNFIRINFWYILLMLFFIGIILHKLFCVKTTIDKLIFSN